MKPVKLNPEWTRRKLLQTGAAGAGIVIVPGYVLGCGGAAAKATSTTPPVGEVAGMDMGYFKSFGVDEAVVRQVMAAAMDRGGDYADLFFQHSVSSYVALQDGAVNRAYSSIELGCGVRVLKGDQTGFAFTEDLSVQALVAAAKTASVVAAGPATGLQESFQRIQPPEYYAIEVPWTDTGIDRKMPLLERANARAMAADPRVSKVQVFLADSTEHVMIATSDGRMVEDYRPMSTYYVTVVAEDGDKRESNSNSFGGRMGFEGYDDAKVDEITDLAVARTLTLFDATPPPAGEYPVVLAPGLSGILLHEAMGHGFEADFNRKGISVYADKIGQQIAPTDVTIIDDGTVLNSRGAINVDDEANEVKKSVLVENGVLRSYMHDRISAAHYGVEPTGNGRRDCYRFPPVPRMRCTYMDNGPHDPQEIIESVKKGIYCEVFTNGQVRIGSGDFSFYLKNGYVIEDGKLGAPVKDANLIGFGPEVLEKVEMVGNDQGLNSGAGMCGKDGQRVPVGFGLPTIKCGGMSVGGIS